ncbi:MAG: glycosyltransferase family 4 protein [Phycisphaerales bacterium]|nr:glycosyltransferase family 4 protein [Phycisphaerales bacterium]
MMVRRLGIGSYSVVVNANLDWWGGAMAEKLGEAAFVVVHARWIGEDILRRYSRVSAGHLVYAPVGVETAKWTMTTVGGVRHDSTFRIVSVGRLHPSKGHDVLIRAVAELRAAGMSVELRIIGSGPAEHELCRVIGEHDLQEYVMLLGSRSEDDVMAELRNASAFALASHAEPLGVVYMEAMALGLPVVGTAAGGVGEIITPGETGLLVPPNDVSAMAEAIRMLCSDRALCERLGAAARASIVTHYDAAIGAQRLRNVLQSVTTE